MYADFEKRSKLISGSIMKIIYNIPLKSPEWLGKSDIIQVRSH